MAGDLEDHRQVEVAVVFELSKRIRAAFVVCVILLGLIAVALFAHKPPVRDEDLISAVFTPNFAIEMQVRHGQVLSAYFQSNEPAFDYPWNDIARAYSRSSDDTERSRVLAAFFNAEGPTRSAHLLSLVDVSPDVRRTIMRYLEDAKQRWQTFVVPIVEIQVGRDEVAFYLAVLLSFIHVLVIIKMDYLQLIREKFGIRSLPDPSLITATSADLEVFGSIEKSVLLLAQYLISIGIPAFGAAMVGFYFVRYAGMDVAGHTRLFVGLLALIGAAIWSVVVVICIRRDRWKRQIPSMLPFKGLSAGAKSK